MNRRINMISWANDDELFEIMKTELYTAVVGDILIQCIIIISFYRRKFSR